MKSSFRPTSPADETAVLEFLRRAFSGGGEAPLLDSSAMAWKYWDRRDDWDEPRAWVLERDGAIVAHAGIWPLTFGSGEVRGVQMIDWASAREAPGAGLALVQRLSAMFDFIYSIGGSDMTRKALPAFGFQEYARQWNGARPLRPLRQMLTHQYRNWKLAPRALRNSLWALSPGNAGQNDPAENRTWEEITPESIAEDLFLGVGSGVCFSPRRPAFFEYLLRCPIAQVRLFGIRDKNGLAGHFALAILRRQARLAGVWLREPGQGALQTAFALAQQAARRIPGTCEIVAAGTAGPSEVAAVASGFRVVGYSPVYLLNKKGRLDLPPDFQFQLSDSDAWFLDSGSSSYWT